MLLLSRDFIKLVFLAILIALPMAWWGMSVWLNSFAYRINIGPGIFILATGCITFITLLTVSTQALKAAFANPINTLKSE